MLKAFKTILFIVILLSAFNFYKPALLNEFRVNIEKYTRLNIQQNSGFHKLLLKTIQKTSRLFPSYAYVPLYRSNEEVGTEQNNYQSNFLLPLLKETEVSTEQGILLAIQNSLPGTVINIRPGTYYFSGRLINFTAKGLTTAPVILRSEKLGSVIFEMDLIEGILISAPNIQVENIVFKGAAKQKIDTIEHALHIVGNADNIKITNNEFINFNSHIKSNGTLNKTGTRDFPDNVLIHNNNFYNEWKRNTLSPSSPIDVVGGENWEISNNFIADFGKSGRKGRGVAYGAFLKGASKFGLFRGNLINCSWKIPHSTSLDVRVGLSLGNGGTGQKFCMDGRCTYEHIDGKIIGNTIVNCQNDVSIYINKAKNTYISDNYIANSLGIKINGETSSVHIKGNYMDGRVINSSKTQMTLENNYTIAEFIE